jgi:uncharacterized protein YdaU (DUF1376 family)
MPLYIGDYLADTAHLSTEESGAYLYLLMHEWKTGPLPADDDSLRRITRLDRDAWSNAQAVLKQFFTRQDDGTWIQKRLEAERAKSDEKKRVSSEKARKAANAKWNKDAPSIENYCLEDAPSNAQAMLETCPSPSPSQSPLPKQQKQKQKPPKDKPSGTIKSDLIASRHAEFKQAIADFWEWRNPDVEMQWDGMEGKALALYLSSAPKTTVQQFKRFLKNRGDSDNVSQTERPGAWVRSIGKFAGGPLDQYGKPKQPGGSNGRSNSTSKQAATASNATSLVSRILGVDSNRIGQDSDHDGGGGNGGEAYIDGY